MADNSKVIHFDLRNGGTGPAIIEWIRLKWNGQPANGLADFLGHGCGSTGHKDPSVSRDVASGMTLAAGQAQSVLAIAAEGADPDWYRALDTARFKVEADGCYCSVLNECWITDFRTRPRSVKACDVIPENQRW